jgi:hypothetical protein
VLILRYSLDRDGPDDATPDASATELLDRRLARGEIDLADYETRRDAMATRRERG